MLATLHRERLKLRPFNPDDVDAVFEMYSRWEVVQFLGRTPAVLTDRSQAEARVAAWTAFDGALHGVWAQAVCRRLGMTHLGRTDRYNDVACELFRADRQSPRLG